MNKLFRNIAAGALLSIGMPLAAWAQANQNVQVSVTVNASCALTAASNATFAPQSPTGTHNILAEGEVTLRCNAGAVPLLAVNNGLLGTRQMENGPGDLLAYSVRQPTFGAGVFACPAFGGGALWATAGDRLNASAAFASSGGDRDVPVCFQTTVDLSTPVGVYTDTVQVSVSF